MNEVREDLSHNNFQEGYLEYNISNEFPSELSLTEWDDGYLAFSNKEVRLSDFTNLIDFKELEKNRINNIQGIDLEGYLMEACLWRTKGRTVEEISVEREDNGFYVQHWKVSLNYIEGAIPCYFRPIEVEPRINSIFSDIALYITYEVVVPSIRMHFFLGLFQNFPEDLNKRMEG